MYLTDLGCQRKIWGMENSPLDRIAQDVAARNDELGRKRRKPRRYVDYLFWPRLGILLVAIATAVMEMKEVALIFFGAWILLGLANLVMKAVYKQNH